jgi:predicted transcriptional regulator
MAEITPLQGELQVQIMAVMWRLGSGTVEQVRGGLPGRYQGAYTTVQTVLNRLAERGLLSRTRQGNVVVYKPRISEADYLSRTISRTLAGASAPARQTVLAQLIGQLERDELTDVQALAKEIAKQRRGRR